MDSQIDCDSRNEAVLGMLEVMLRKRWSSVSCKSMNQEAGAPISSSILINWRLSTKGIGLDAVSQISKVPPSGLLNLTMDGRKRMVLPDSRASRESIPLAPAHRIWK